MPGKPGSGGPVPKRSEQRRRRNKTDMPVEITPAPPTTPDAPTSSPDWHSIAREWFDSLARSGQAAWYQASDWAQARLVAEMMDRLCQAEKPNAQLFASVLAGASSLLTTEGERRRLRLELARGPQVDEDEEASVTALADYMRENGG